MYNRRAESIASSTINLLRLPLHRRRTSLLLVSLRCRLKCLRKSDNDKVLARVSVGTTEKRMLGIEKGANVILILVTGRAHNAKTPPRNLHTSCPSTLCRVTV